MIKNSQIAVPLFCMLVCLFVCLLACLLQKEKFPYSNNNRAQNRNDNQRRTFSALFPISSPLFWFVLLLLYPRLCIYI
ncbi:hypothetical protein F5X99DRAFT_5600 [Biscogniauxia marginata]|nr:hypothetical protein F5X99DRAFT_5600 [Biscogniauxia marginata]